MGFWSCYLINLKEKGYYSKGIKNGLFECYYDNGKIWYRVTYINGERNGYYTEFHLNGIKKWKGIFRDDKYDRKWTEYDSNGEVIQELKYIGGMRYD